MQQALEALEQVKHMAWSEDSPAGRSLIHALREKLAQPEQEPVAFMYEFYADRGCPGLSFEPQRSAVNTPLYTAPQPEKNT